MTRPVYLNSGGAPLARGPGAAPSQRARQALFKGGPGMRLAEGAAQERSLRAVWADYPGSAAERPEPGGVAGPAGLAPLAGHLGASSAQSCGAPVGDLPPGAPAKRAEKDPDSDWREDARRRASPARTQLDPDQLRISLYGDPSERANSRHRLLLVPRT